MRSEFDDGLEAAAKECERHAAFCRAEAHKGGDFSHLITRAQEANSLARMIRMLKLKGRP